MSRSRRGARVAALALTLLFLAAQALFGAGLPRADAQTLHDRPQRLKLNVDNVTPRVIHGDAETLTITGSITNVGDRRITDLMVRLELGQRLTTEAQARAALRGPLPGYPSASPFTPVSDALRPGESTELRLRVPLDGSPGGLRLTGPGVYPVLVNINGTPDYGGQARLSAFNLLLPVRGAGGDNPTTEPGTEDTPTGLSLLWPITSRTPAVVRDVYGKPLVLADDSLAGALAPGGRLHSLVTAAATAFERDRISSALCFALDPALLSTVQAMTGGYQVRTTGGLVAGKGVKAAKQWLAELRQTVRGRCVVQLPYADANLNALPRVGSTANNDAERLTPLAVDGADVIRNLLGVRPLKGVLWPGTELSEQATRSAAEAGVSTIITSAAQLPARSTSAGGTSAVEISGTGLRAQAFDPLSHRALEPGPAMADVAVQNGIGALAFRTRQQQHSGARPILVAPPHRWGAPAGELETFLRTLGDFADAGMIEPVSLPQSLATETTGSVPASSATVESTSVLSAQMVDTLSEVDATTTDLAAGMSVDATSLVQPEALVRPLRQAVLRASSTAWQGNQTGRGSAVRAATEQVDAITSQVAVTPPPQPIALASGDSPLPVYISNTLPVTITVRIRMLNNAGLRPEQIPYQTIPANSARNRNINIEPLRAGRITVQVKLSTPAGAQLGKVARFELVSTEYGMITVAVTSTAAGALLLLSGRRIYRRIRARRAQPPAG